MTDRELDHEYDGIREYDNPMPGWWKATYAGSVVFAIGYAIWLYGGLGGKSVAEEYAEDLAQSKAKAAAQAAASVKEADLAPLLANSDAVAAGKAKFASTCAVCHGDRAEGKIGPNLTDDAWLHGKGTLVDLFRSVHDGVPDKGMPTWGKLMQPEELRQVVAFLGTVRGTNVAGKEAQGERVAR